MHLTCKLFGHKPAELQVSLDTRILVFLLTGETATVVFATKREVCQRCGLVRDDAPQIVSIAESEKAALERMAQ